MNQQLTAQQVERINEAYSRSVVKLYQRMAGVVVFGIVLFSLLNYFA